MPVLLQPEQDNFVNCGIRLISQFSWVLMPHVFEFVLVTGFSNHRSVVYDCKYVPLCALKLYSVLICRRGTCKDFFHVCQYSENWNELGISLDFRCPTKKRLKLEE